MTYLTLKLAKTIVDNEEQVSDAFNDLFKANVQNQREGNEHLSNLRLKPLLLLMSEISGQWYFCTVYTFSNNHNEFII